MKRKEYLTRQDKIVDFIIGFIGFVVLNGAIYLSLAYLADILKDVEGSEIIGKGVTCAWFVLPWVINIGLLVFCAWWRLWMATGAFCALGLAGMLAILAGVCLVVGCLTILGMIVLTEIMGVQL